MLAWILLCMVGGVAQRVPGALLPVCTCLDVLGARVDRDCSKRLLQMCMKGASVKETWQVRLPRVSSMCTSAVMKQAVWPVAAMLCKRRYMPQ